MRRFVFIALLFCVSLLLACKNHQSSTTKGVAASKELQRTDSATTVKAPLQRFIVSFYSIGSGAEGKQIEKLKVFLPDFENKIGRKISYSTARWGREGEIDFCFPLKELTVDQQKKFINDIKSTLQTANWVHYSENAPCRE